MLNAPLCFKIDTFYENMGLLIFDNVMKVHEEMNKLPANRFQMADKQTE